MHFRKNFGFAALIATTTLITTACDTVGPLILQSSVHGEELYSALTKQWVRWAMALPNSTGPITDMTGAACDQGQYGGVWFLAGTSGGEAERECTIPADTALFFPLMNGWVIPDPETVDEPDELAGFLNWAAGYFAGGRAHTCELTLLIDGEPILQTTEELDTELYVEVLEPFGLYLNDDNWASQYGKPGGWYSIAIADGHWALLEPLPAGDYVLEFGGTICDGETIYFETHVTYTLHVEE